MKSFLRRFQLVSASDLDMVVEHFNGKLTDLDKKIKCLERAKRNKEYGILTCSCGKVPTFSYTPYDYAYVVICCEGCGRKVLINRAEGHFKGTTEEAKEEVIRQWNYIQGGL